MIMNPLISQVQKWPICFTLVEMMDFVKKLLSVIIQFLLCGCFFYIPKPSKFNKIFVYYVMHKIGTNTPLIIGGFHMK